MVLPLCPSLFLLFPSIPPLYFASVKEIPGTLFSLSQSNLVCGTMWLCNSVPTFCKHITEDILHSFKGSHRRLKNIVPPLVIFVCFLIHKLMLSCDSVCFLNQAIFWFRVLVFCQLYFQGRALIMDNSAKTQTAYNISTINVTFSGGRNTQILYISKSTAK